MATVNFLGYGTKVKVVLEEDAEVCVVDEPFGTPVQRVDFGEEVTVAVVPRWHPRAGRHIDGYRRQLIKPWVTRAPREGRGRSGRA